MLFVDESSHDTARTEFVMKPKKSGRSTQVDRPPLVLQHRRIIEIRRRYVVVDNQQLPFRQRPYPTTRTSMVLEQPQSRL